ncbi:MAG: response regulator transcription factor [Gemmatimonadetes bacterium]|nr:response regulator transcription factor [Gemmatimonadota bacterium]
MTAPTEAPTADDLAVRVLVIDDEAKIRQVVCSALAGEGVTCTQAADGAEGLALAAAEQPDLIVLDLGLPDQDGIDVWEKEALLDAGADDYVTKPFGVIEFRARVRAQLRRARMVRQPTPDAPLRLGALTVDVARRTLVRDGAPVHLTPTEWQLLLALLRRPGRTVTHRQLFREVWNDSYGDTQQYLRVYIAHLRKKIESDPYAPRHLITEPGVGYRLEIGD